MGNDSRMHFIAISIWYVENIWRVNIWMMNNFIFRLIQNATKVVYCIYVDHFSSYPTTIQIIEFNKLEVECMQIQTPWNPKRMKYCMLIIKSIELFSGSNQSCSWRRDSILGLDKLIDMMQNLMKVSNEVPNCGNN